LTGGTLSLDKVNFVNNSAEAAGSVLNLDAGSVIAFGVSIEEAVSSVQSIGGASSLGLVCSSPCSAGEFGLCDRVSASNAPNCLANCQCESCPAGTANPFSGATSNESCVACGSGQVSSARATTCSSCPAGTYASDAPSDGGSQRGLVLAGASVCNECPAGYFSDTAASLICQSCQAGRISFTGSVGCEICELILPNLGHIISCVRYVVFILKRFSWPVFNRSVNCVQ
jgi:hypothetical protein